MPSIRISEMRNSSALRIYAEREGIQVDPDYQRMGEVWNLEKQQLLVDTILNELDMPKLYFHEFATPHELEDGRTVKYAVIDGRQRLEAIWGYIDGKFPLSDSFEYFGDTNIDAKGLTYADLGASYQFLKTILDSYTMPVMNVLTDDQDLIEEMFSRLNEAVPLNAAEKRNAMGGPMAPIIRDVASHAFFRENVPFSNGRYQHMEIAAKFLLLAWTGGVADTRKVYLDNMVETFRKDNLAAEARQTGKEVQKVLNWAHDIFVARDILLRTHAMTVVYFQVFKDASENAWTDLVTRQKLVQFDEVRANNRKLAETDMAQATYELLEFDRMQQQGTNDRTSIDFRVRTLTKYLMNG